MFEIQFVIFGTFADGLHHDDFELFDGELVVLQFLGCLVVGIGDLALCHEADAIESHEVVHLLPNGRGEHTKKCIDRFVGQAQLTVNPALAQKDFGNERIRRQRAFHQPALKEAALFLLQAFGAQDVLLPHLQRAQVILGGLVV